MASVQITNGAGNQSYGLEIDNTYHAKIRGVTESEKLEAIENGNGWNFNTKRINITAASGIAYLKNTSSYPLLVEAVAIGTGEIQGGGAKSDIGDVTIYLNSTTGTLIDGASDMPIIANRNSSTTIALPGDFLVYKGASGNTITDGDETLFLYHKVDSRSFFSINLEVETGGSIAVHYDPNLSSGNVDVYCAFVAHFKTIGF